MAYMKMVISAIVGGALAAIVVLLVGVNHSKTTTIIEQQAPASERANAALTQTTTTTSGLTAGDIYKRDASGVVAINATVVEPASSGGQSIDPFNLFGQGQQQQQQQGQQSGSGIVLDKNGTILTNWHVVQGATKVNVQFGQSGKPITAKVIGSDPSDDLAILRIPTSGLTLTPLTLGNSSNVQVGDPTLAIGNPFGLDRTLTTGVVSALQRSITAPNGFTIDNVIQTDAPINPGNSGGPLLNAQGQVIGINSQIESSSSNGSIGIGFAVPINTAKQIIPQLERSGSIQQAYLGIITATIDSSLSGLNLPVSQGALVQTVQPNTPAAKAGIKGGNITATLGDGSQIYLGGDIITAIDGQPVASSTDLGNIIATKKPGQNVTITVLRAGKKTNITVTLGTRPSSVPNPNTPQG